MVPFHPHLPSCPSHLPCSGFSSVSDNGVGRAEKQQHALQELHPEVCYCWGEMSPPLLSKTVFQLLDAVKKEVTSRPATTNYTCSSCTAAAALPFPVLEPELLKGGHVVCGRGAILGNSTSEQQSHSLTCDPLA